VVVFKTSKENGTNVQISFIKSMRAWLVASKNTSILIRDEKYDSLAKDLASNWLKTLVTLDLQKRENLKYENAEFRFFALVELESNDTCVPIKN